ncbi:uncharacterized protein LOC126485030 [Schistocerca serialis cubense]|uniref:uncharacterized protein LOC126485030 n=1 Tax=Schistocerca serialis cubense TaxID=2023355 RepID=UPI00214E34AC|nr:uncharacterized protein LOC126485030 [Schistocerca serialis cubense]
MRKYDKLQQKATDETLTLDRRRTVVNLSSHTLSEATTAMLAKGMNFAVAPKRVPKEDIIESVEASVRHLPQAEAEKIRQETVRVLNKAKSPKQNINAEEYHAIKELRDNPHLVVVQADKGNATVVLDTTDYNRRMEDILAEPIYKKLQGDPTAKVIKTTQALLKHSRINFDKARRFIPQVTQAPRIYGVPKPHCHMGQD